MARELAKCKVDLAEARSQLSEARSGTDRPGNLPLDLSLSKTGKTELGEEEHTRTSLELEEATADE